MLQMVGHYRRHYKTFYVVFCSAWLACGEMKLTSNESFFKNEDI